MNGGVGHTRRPLVLSALRVRGLRAGCAAVAAPCATAFAAITGTGFNPTSDNTDLWAQDAARFNDLFGAAVNARRASLGLAEISDVRSHMMTDQPWLAADRKLAPWPGVTDGLVFQTGAWILPDERPLSRDLDRFLEGDPPIYFGLGSTRATRGASGDATCRSRTPAAGDRIEGVVRRLTRGERTRLPLHRRG